MKVSGENAFSIPTTSFSISPSAQGYTLNYSADGVHFTAYSGATEAGVTTIVNGIAKGMIFKLVGNTDDVYVVY